MLASRHLPGLHAVARKGTEGAWKKGFSVCPGHRGCKLSQFRCCFAKCQRDRDLGGSWGSLQSLEDRLLGPLVSVEEDILPLLFYRLPATHPPHPHTPVFTHAFCICLWADFCSPYWLHWALISCSHPSLRAV